MADDKSPREPSPARGSQSAKGAKSPVSPSGSNPTSPKSKRASPREGTPQAPAIEGILPAQHWVDVEQENPRDDEDADSLAGSNASTTASLTSNILKYRNIQGRTYHSEVGNAAYCIANDSRQSESMDINHHSLTLLLDGKLFLAPLQTDKIKKVLDIGTGTGTWAIDFADEYPDIEVIGTDISPIQPGWVPPNLKFEIEDCTLDWTFQPESVDYVHIRWLNGSIRDWEALCKQAYQALRPGGWLECFEACPLLVSDDDTVPEESALGQWGKLYINYGKTTGQSFTLGMDETLSTSMQAAGLVDINEVKLKTPVGTWPKDPKLKEIGEYAHAVVDIDPEGYILYPALSLGWSPEEVTVYVAHMRRELRSPHTHPYYHQKVVWGRKPF